MGRHFCGLVMAITVGHCSTIERLSVVSTFIFPFSRVAVEVEPPDEAHIAPVPPDPVEHN